MKANMITRCCHLIITLYLLLATGSCLVLPRLPTNVSVTPEINKRLEPPPYEHGTGNPSEATTPPPPGYDEPAPTFDQAMAIGTTSGFSSYYDLAVQRGHAKLALFDSPENQRRLLQHFWLERGFAQGPYDRDRDENKLPANSWQDWNLVVVPGSLVSWSIGKLLKQVLDVHFFDSSYVKWERKPIAGSSSSQQSHVEVSSDGQLTLVIMINALLVDRPAHASRLHLRQAKRYHQMRLSAGPEGLISRGGAIVVYTIDGEMTYPTALPKYAPNPPLADIPVLRPSDLLANQWRKPFHDPNQLVGNPSNRPPGTFAPYVVVFAGVKAQTIETIQEAYKRAGRDQIPSKLSSRSWLSRKGANPAVESLAALLGSFEGVVAAEMLLNYFPGCSIAATTAWDATWLLSDRDRYINLASKVAAPTMKYAGVLADHTIMPGEDLVRIPEPGNAADIRAKFSGERGHVYIGEDGDPPLQ